MLIQRTRIRNSNTAVVRLRTNLDRKKWETAQKRKYPSEMLHFILSSDKMN